jgi:hypothetical protein
MIERRQCDAQLKLRAPMPTDGNGRGAVRERACRATPPLKFLPLNLEADE